MKRLFNSYFKLRLVKRRANKADFISPKTVVFRPDPVGRVVPAHLSCISSCAPRLRGLTMKNREKNRKGKDRIWKEKREDEGAAYWGEGLHCE